MIKKITASIFTLLFSLATASFAGISEDRASLNQKAKEYSEKVAIYTASKTDEMSVADEKIQALRHQIVDEKDPVRSDLSRKKIQLLTKERQETSAKLAEYLLGVSNQQLEFAQERVLLAERQLAEARAVLETPAAKN